MKVYENSFVYGRELVKKLVIAVVACYAVALMLGRYPVMQIVMMIGGLVFFVTAGVVVFKQCRCPYCKKTIVLGVLAITHCPRCKRNLVTGRKTKKSR